MATKLERVFEKTKKVGDTIQLQEIRLWVEVSEAQSFLMGDISYNDFKADLYIGGYHVAEISDLLDKAGVFIGMVDAVDWDEMLKEEQQRREDIAADALINENLETL